LSKLWVVEFTVCGLVFWYDVVIDGRVKQFFIRFCYYHELVGIIIIKKINDKFKNRDFKLAKVVHFNQNK